MSAHDGLDMALEATLAATAVPNPIQSTALARPAHVVLIADEGRWTAAQLRDDVALLAGRLAAWGVRPGMRVALAGPPSADWVLSWHALGWVGATVAPIACDQPDVEVDRCLTALQAERVVLTQGLRDEMRDKLTARFGAGATTTAALPQAAPLPERFWPWDEPRAAVLTSGTTEAARLVPVTTAQWVLSAFGSAIRLGHSLDDRWLACLPLHHVGGLSILMRCAWYGITLVLHPRFVAARVARAIDAGEVTLASLVPTMLERVLEVREPKPFPRSVRAVLLGGSAPTAGLLDQCRGLGVPLAVTWGMTEAASQVATRLPGDLDPASGCGAPLPFARVTAQGDTLEVHGPLVRGVLRTNDRGGVDEAGRVHVAGRADDVIISGGENIAPEEIERVLEQHPAVREACVLGVADRRWGERPVALLVARAGASRPSDAALDTWCRERLASFKVPERYIWRDSLSSGEMGKRSRRRLREMLAAAHPDLFGREAGAAQPVDELGRQGARREGLQIEDGVHELGDRPHLAVRADDRVTEGERALAHALELDADGQALAHANGPTKVGLGVHQRRAPAARAKRRLGAAKDAGHQLFVRLVAVLKHAPEEHDTGAVHFEESRSASVLERHFSLSRFASLEDAG